MYKIFEELLEKNNVTAYRVSKETGVSTSTLTQWKKGISTPKQDKLQKIADYFNVSIEYLMDGTESKNYYLNEETAEMAQELFENPELRSLFKMSRNMTPERLKAHIEFMKKLEEQENK